MMISPETYYELNLKEKNEKELLSAIRGLKNKIGNLKNIMEHPDYRPQVRPDEATQIWCMNLYLERTKQALKDLGGTYIPSRAELKAMEFNDNIQHIKEIKFSIGGFFQGQTDYIFRFEDDILQKRITKLLEKENEIKLSPEDKDDFLDRFASLKIGEWRSNYNTERFGYTVMDGTQWKLEIHYNGYKTRSYYGSNAYPYNFDALLDLFESDYEEEFEDDYDDLDYTIHSDDKNDLLYRMFEKIKELPFETEISTSQLLGLISTTSYYIDGKYVYDDLALEMKDMFSLDFELKTTAINHGIKIDDTIHAGEILGMPYNIGFLIKSY